MKIAFFAGPNGFTFLRKIIDYFSSKYEVKVFDVPADLILQGSIAQDVFYLMSWSDISWFEWCEPPLTYATQFPKVCKIIVRLHRYEAYTNLPSMVNWSNVDIIIFVSQFPKKVFEERFTIPVSVRRVVIPNAIDVSDFDVDLTKKKKNSNIAFIGGFRVEKNPMLAFYCLEKLNQSGSRYKLFHGGFGGDHHTIEVEVYLKHLLKELGLEKNVIWEGRIENVKEWLTDKSYFLSTSIVEGHPVGVMEAMACGCKPIIHNFPGASDIFPKKYIFNTIDEFVKKVTSPSFDPYEYRRFIEKNYSFSSQINQIEKVLNSLLKEAE